MSLLVAVFNEKSDRSGTTITYEDARHQFIAQDRGPLDAQALLDYDAQGQLDWTDEGLREWTRRAARAAAPVTPEPPSPSGEAAAAARRRPSGAPVEEAARLSPALRHTAAGAVEAASVGPSPMPADAMPDPAGPGPTSASQGALAEAGFICSLFGLGVPFLGLLGLILSVAARRQAQRLGMATGLPTAGIVIGVISTVVGLLLVLVALVG